jgi:hypothetical protein
MEIEKVTTIGRFMELRDEWNAFVENCRWSCVNLTHDWLVPWWEAFGGEARLRALLFRKEGRLVGIAPLMLKRDRFRGLPVKALTLMLNGHCPEGGILLENLEEAFVHLAKVLHDSSGEWDVLRLQRLPENHLHGEVMEKYFKQNGFQILQTGSVRIPYTDITCPWNDYYASRPKKFRKVMRNKLNRMNRDGLLSAARLTGAEITTERLAEMFEISYRSWKRRIKKAIPDDARVEKFYRKLTATLGKKGDADLWLMRRNGRAIAFEYHVRHRGITYPIRADYDESYQSLSPGSLLEYTIMRHLFEDKEIRGYNSCGQTYDYLLNWATNLVEHVDLHVFNSRMYSKGLFRLESRILPVARGAKSFIGRYSRRGHHEHIETVS